MYSPAPPPRPPPPYIIRAMGTPLYVVAKIPKPRGGALEVGYGLAVQQNSNEKVCKYGKVIYHTYTLLKLLFC